MTATAVRVHYGCPYPGRNRRLFRDCLARYGPPTTRFLYLVAGAARRRQLADEVLDSFPCLFEIPILTFDGLVRSLLKDGAFGARILAESEKRALLERILRSGRFKLGENPSRIPGLVPYVSQYVASMKRQGIEDEPMLRLKYEKLNRSLTPLETDLIEVFTSYQRCLEERGLEDKQGRRCRLYRGLLNGEIRVSRRYPDLRRLVVEGLYTLNPMERGILSLISSEVEECIFSIDTTGWSSPEPAKPLPGAANGAEPDTAVSRLELRLGKGAEACFEASLAPGGVSEEGPHSAREEGCDGVSQPLSLLASVSRTHPAADLEMAMSTALRSVGLLDLLSSTRAGPSLATPCVHGHLPSLATTACEKFGLARMEAQWVFRPAPTRTLAVDFHRPATREDEVIRVAQRIRRLGVEELTWASIGVVCARPGHYSAYFSEVFSEFGIPFRLLWGRPALEGASHSALSAFLRLLENNFEADDLFDFLDSPGIRVPGFSVREIRLMERLGRVAGMAGGSQEWLSDFPAFIRAYLKQSRGQGVGKDLERVEAVYPRFLQLISRLGMDIRGERSCLDWLRGISKRLGPLLVSDPEGTLLSKRRENVLWQSLIGELGKTAVIWSDRPVEFCRLGALVARLARNPSHCELDEDGVLVGRPQDLQQVRLEHLFWLGLAEGEFPNHPTSQVFFGDADGNSWDSPSWEASLQESRYLWEVLISSARKGVYLSCPMHSGDAPVMVSHFWRELSVSDRPLNQASQTAHRKQVPPFPQHGRAERGAPAAAETLAASFCETSVISPGSRGLDPRPNVLPAPTSRQPSTVAPEGERDELSFWHSCDPAVAKNIVRGIRVQSLRETLPLSPFEGVFSSSEMRSLLRARHFSKAIRVSPSHLEDYLSCGFRYFMGRVLRLRSLGEPDPELTPSERGSLIHRVLYRFMKEISEESDGCGEETRESWIHRQRARMAAILGDELDAARPSCRRDDDLFSKHQEARLRDGLGRPGKGLLSEFIDQQWERIGNSRVVALEMEVGPLLLGAVGTAADSAPLIPVYVQGKIDRVDRGPEGLFIVDYKIGQDQRQRLYQGWGFQLPLYILMSEERLGESVAGAGFYVLQFPSHVGLKPLRFQAQEAGQKQILQQVTQYYRRKALKVARHLYGGHFPLTLLGEARAGCATCDYRHICRFERDKMEKVKASGRFLGDELLVENGRWRDRSGFRSSAGRDSQARPEVGPVTPHV